jgi:hypothetical protein
MAVTFPPGRLKLATRPSLMGSPPVKKTIGIVAVAALAARAALLPIAKITTTCCRHGWAKLMKMSGAASYLTSLKVPNPGFWVWPSCAVFDRRGAILSRQLATQSLKPQQVQDYRCTPITCQHSGNGAGLQRQIEC